MFAATALERHLQNRLFRVANFAGPRLGNIAYARGREVADANIVSSVIGLAASPPVGGSTTGGGTNVTWIARNLR